MSGPKRYRHLTFGVQPGRARYRLRQARYFEMAEDVSRFARETRKSVVRLLDAGVHSGVSRRYLEARPGGEKIEYHGVDIYPRGREFVYKHEEWNLCFADLEFGLPALEDNRFDVVLCEQVLEHLYNVEFALEELARVLAPGGLMILGVPNFPPGLANLRKHVVPLIDRWVGRGPRSHVQAWSLAEFRDLAARATKCEVTQARGFRFVSGGPLRPLEHFRWWWRLNRAGGAVAPAFCTEIQLVLRKPELARGKTATQRAARKEKAALEAAW